MIDIMKDIIAHKRKEVAERQELYPAKLLERSIFFSSPTVSLKSFLEREDKVGIIAEIKRKSPSKGEFHRNLSVEELSLGYMQAGASALSVLTDSKYFGGSLDDLRTARRFNLCPILRKDFVVSPYQIVEARSAGADVVLLIAAALAPEELRELARFARQLGLEVLLEVHDERELETYLSDDIDLVGVNNRNLSTFEVSVRVSEELADKIPSRFPKISESGIGDAETIRRLKSFGYKGFLIGEAFMRTPKPANACRALVSSVTRG